MKIRILLAGAVTVAVAAALVGCSSGSGSSDTSTTSSNKGVTLTYWASNQGASLDNDKEILTPVIDQFTKQTGIKVNLEVVPWSDLTNNTLAAAVSGQGPDVLNIGNTNAVTFQSTGAFYGWDSKALAKIGGKDHFVASSFATAGAPGQDPTSIPLYSQAYGLFYNKQIFADAGLKPPTTWEELVSDAKALTNADENKWGLAVPAGTVNVSMHFSYIFGAQNGGSAFDSSGKPTFTSKGMVAGVQQYVDLLSKDHVINPSDVQYTDGTQAAGAFAKGNAAMYFAQTGGINTLRQNGMDPDAYGVVPIPAPKGGKDIGVVRGRIEHLDLQEHEAPRRLDRVRQVHDQRQDAGDPEQGVHDDPRGQGCSGGVRRLPGAAEGLVADPQRERQAPAPGARHPGLPGQRRRCGRRSDGEGGDRQRRVDRRRQAGARRRPAEDGRHGLTRSTPSVK